MEGMYSTLISMGFYHVLFWKNLLSLASSWYTMVEWSCCRPPYITFNMGMNCCQSRQLPHCASLVERLSLFNKTFYLLWFLLRKLFALYLSLTPSFLFIYLSLFLSISLSISLSLPLFSCHFSFFLSLFLILFVTLSYGSICSVVFPITVTPQMINPQDTSLIVQTAIKNMTTNGVFYFGIPVSMEVRNIRNK